MLTERAGGILLHLTSLPSEFGIGDPGSSAFRFVDFLVEAGQRFWQILPVHPTDSIFGHSPYSIPSAFAANPLFISPAWLVERGLLSASDLSPLPVFPPGRVDYESAASFKSRILGTAWNRFRPTEEFHEVCRQQESWLNDFALFAVLKAHFSGRPWYDWPAELRNRNFQVLRAAEEHFHDEIGQQKFLQFLFHSQWTQLRGYCAAKGVRILGDFPIYVLHDSADVWVHRELFDLDHNAMPRVVSGVPPDRFSETGQLWGTPVYNWERMKETGFDWWIQRLKRSLQLFDWIRLDHFRGYAGYWVVPAGAKTAAHGYWKPGPGADFLHAICHRIPSLKLIAEDLGSITPDVIDLIERFELPGMRPLLSAFSSAIPDHPATPHRHVPNCVVYTGTHDNNTVRGWYENESTEKERDALQEYAGGPVSAENVHDALIRLALRSVARLTILPMQDVLGLGEEARMNRPSRSQGNWLWRLTPDQCSSSIAAGLRHLMRLYGRMD